MSWDSYIDNLISQSKDAAGTAHCDKACIIGLDGGSKWTTDGHSCQLLITAEEAQKVARICKGKTGEFPVSGGVIGGTKYQFLREEEEKLYLFKKKDQGAITMQLSKTAIVIGHTAEGCQQGNVNKAVAVIAEYLESLGM